MIEFQPREMRLKGLIRVRGAPAPPDHRNAAVPEIGDRHDLGERPPATVPADVKQTDTLHHIGRLLGDRRRGSDKSTIERSGAHV
jgi:hypothetical protein